CRAGVRAISGHRIAGAGGVALIGGGAGLGRAALAGAVLTGVAAGADEIGGAWGRDCGARARAVSRHRIAGAGVVALIGGGAGLGRAALAGAVLTGVADGECIVVAACGAICRAGVRAISVRRIAGAGDVALIGGGAGLGRAALAGAVLTGVAAGAD